MIERASFGALIAALIHKTANAAEKGGAALAVAGGLTATELAAIGGFLIALLGFVVNTALNWYFKAQHLKIAQQKALADQDD